MRIIVVGSETDQVADAEVFRNVAIQLGAAIAAESHELFLISDALEHVDVHVLNGYATKPASLPEVLISQGSPDDKENAPNKFAKERAAYPKLRFRDVVYERKYPLNRVEIVRECDVMIVLGGRTGTARMAEIAFVFGKPVVPLPFHGGSAAEIWKGLEYAYREVLTRDDITTLSAPPEGFSAARAAKVIAIAARLMRAAEEKADKILPYWTLPAMEPLCGATWFVIVANHDRLPVQVVMLILLVLMSIMGVFLRAATRVFRETHSVITAKTLLVELAVAFGISFAFFLIFQLGGNSFSDDFEAALRSKSLFHKAAVFVSALSLSAAYLLEQALDRLRTSLIDRWDVLDQKTKPRAIE